MADLTQHTPRLRNAVFHAFGSGEVAVLGGASREVEICKPVGGYLIEQKSGALSVGRACVASLDKVVGRWVFAPVSVDQRGQLSSGPRTRDNVGQAIRCDCFT